jgi:amino acid transporter
VNWKNIFARKDLEVLLAEAAGEHRLHRVLGPWSLTALGVGCIIGAGIFVVTGRAAALDAGPAVIVSYAVAGIGCALAALCYAEFAAMAPVAGSAYTYAYTTLGEIFAWIIGWDLILEYAMGCATVASAWTKYFNKLLDSLKLPQVPYALSNPPWTVDSSLPGYVNLPAIILVGLITYILVIGIRESARTNATLVLIKLVVVVFVIAMGLNYVKPSNWTTVPVTERALPQDKRLIPEEVSKYEEAVGKLRQSSSDYPSLFTVQQKEQFQTLADATKGKSVEINKKVSAQYHLLRRMAEIEEQRDKGKVSAEDAQRELKNLTASLDDLQGREPEQKAIYANILDQVNKKSEGVEAESWGMLGTLGLNRWFLPIDNAVRNRFMPYGFSGIMLGAAIVFFAFIGFDSISTHSEEARNPQRDVPFGILMSLFVCTILYIAVAAVITGMVRYPDIDVEAPIASAFTQQAGAENSWVLRGSSAIIAAGGLAGMTSVLLVLFLSQARVFMAMSRDGLLPTVFGTVHPKFQTPHVATMVTGTFIAVTAGFTPIKTLHEMVNIGTLLAFVMVCAAVFLLRFQRPQAARPFRCPMIYFVAPAGIFVNVLMMLFLPVDSWLRLVCWLFAGLIIYFAYSQRHSHLAKHLMQEIGMPRKEVTGTKFDPEEVE